MLSQTWILLIARNMFDDVRNMIVESTFRGSAVLCLQSTVNGGEVFLTFCLPFVLQIDL